MDDSFKKREEEILKELKNVEKEIPYAAITNASDIYSKVTSLRIELLRLSSIRIEVSSKRFAKWSLFIAVVAIIISTLLSIHMNENCADYGNEIQCFKFYNAGIFSWTEPGKIIPK